MRSYDLAPPPPPSPHSRQQVIFLSQSSCVSPVEHTDGIGAEGVGEEPEMRLRESLVLYKPFNTLWIVHTAYPSMGCSAASQAIPAAAAANKVLNVSCTVLLQNVYNRPSSVK